MVRKADVTVVMYHYVRPLALGRYPRIKARELSDFDEQLNYLDSSFVLLSMEDFLEASTHQCLPRNAALLTFDDGFVDHYSYVLPRLVDRGMVAAFYPPAAPLNDFSLLDVHRIHFILASAPSSAAVRVELEALMRQSMTFHEIEKLRATWEEPNGFDSAEVIFIKRALQVALPQDLRREFCSSLFRRFVSIDEPAFVEELYMSAEHLKLMRSLGMHIGSHANTHEWLSHLSPVQQHQEIQASLDMLASIGVDTQDGWTMAFPYGDGNDTTREIIGALGCRAAFTTEPRRAQPDEDGMLNLPRVDTVSLHP